MNSERISFPQKKKPVISSNRPGWRRKKAGGKKKKKIGRYILLLLIFFGFVYWVTKYDIGLTAHAATYYEGVADFSASYFKLKKIKIRGAVKSSPEEIVKGINFDIGDNIFTFNKRESIRIKEEVEWIKDLTARIELPDTLIIEVKERKPIGYLGKGYELLFDEEGAIIKNNTGEIYSFPHLVLEIKTLPERYLSDDVVRRFKDMVKVFGKVDDDFGERADWNIYVNIHDDMVIEAGGWRLVFGNENISEKLDRFLGVESDIKNRFAEVPSFEVDLRFNDRVIITNPQAG